MNLSEARDLRERRAQLVFAAQEILSQKTVTAEDRAKFDQMMADADKLMERIDRLEAPPDMPLGFNGRVGNLRGYSEEDRTHSRAFGRFLHEGAAALDAEERAVLRRDTETRDGMVTGGGNALQGTGGGYFVPVGFVNDVEQALKDYGHMLQVATIMTTATGNPLPYPTSNDTANTGSLVAEAGQVSEVDVTLGNLTFGAYKYSSGLVKVSIELMQDSAFDLESFLKQQFAIRLGRILNTHFTTGTGSSQPNGIITAATAGVTATGSSTNDGVSGNDGTNSIGSDDLLGLVHSVDPLYRPGAMFMLNDSTLHSIRMVKDKYGRPLWQPGTQAGAPDTILGYRYAINVDMDEIAASKKTVLFGNLKKYVVRRVKQLSVLRLSERYADYGQVGFLAFARYDGNLLDAGTHPVKYLTQAAAS